MKTKRIEEDDCVTVLPSATKKIKTTSTAEASTAASTASTVASTTVASTVASTVAAEPSLLLHTVLILVVAKDKILYAQYLLPIAEMPPLLLDSLLMFGTAKSVKKMMDMEHDSDMKKACYFIYRLMPFIRHLNMETSKVKKSLRKVYERVTMTKWIWDLYEDDNAGSDGDDYDQDDAVFRGCHLPRDAVRDFLSNYRTTDTSVISTSLKKEMFPEHDPQHVVIDHSFIFFDFSSSE